MHVSLLVRSGNADVRRGRTPDGFASMSQPAQSACWGRTGRTVLTGAIHSPAKPLGSTRKSRPLEQAGEEGVDDLCVAAQSGGVQRSLFRCDEKLGEKTLVICSRGLKRRS